MGYPDQVGVRELRSGPLVAVVHEHLQSRGLQLSGDMVRGFPHPVGLVQGDGNDDDVERRDGVRPDDAARVVALFDGRGRDPGHADPVAAHVHAAGAAAGVQHRRAHGVAVLGAELEDVPHFYAPGDGQRSSAGGAGISRHRVTKVRHGRQGHVPLPVHAGVVVFGPIGAAREVADP